MVQPRLKRNSTPKLPLMSDLRPLGSTSLGSAADSASIHDVKDMDGSSLSPGRSQSTFTSPTKKATTRKRSRVVSPSPVKRRKPSTTQSRTVSTPAKTKSKSSVLPTTKGVLTSAAISQINSSQQWIDLKIPPSELRPSATVTTGQCFHWKAVLTDDDVDSPPSSPTDASALPSSSTAWGAHDATEWIGTLRMSEDESVVISLRETPQSTLYRPLTTTTTQSFSSQLTRSLVRDYFQYKEEATISASDKDDSSSLQLLYAEWSLQDKRLATIAKCIPGVRIVSQDPWECLVSFICSSNNNIPRITKILTAIRQTYGTKLLTVPIPTNGDDEQEEESFYSFPSLQEMIRRNATEDELRSTCGLGYRAKYIVETVTILQGYGGEAYLHRLKQNEDGQETQETIQAKLCEFCGVGRKVADCVALFSLHQVDAIPVDVHVWNIAKRDYDSDHQLPSSSSSLTPKLYRQVGDLFRTRFPNKAGWAHSLLFVAELPSFRPVLPSHILEEMDQFRQEETRRKQDKKAAATEKKKLTARKGAKKSRKVDK